MGIGLTLSIEMLIKTISEFNPEEKFEIQLTNAEMIREAASVIANTSEEEIIDLKERKKKRNKIFFNSCWTSEEM